jgi:site-specific recombinase XerC
MIYGYDLETINEYGLRRMRDVSIAAGPSSLRSLAQFIIDVAAEIEDDAGSKNPNWHRHLPAALKQELGCDIVICGPEAPT